MRLIDADKLNRKKKYVFKTKFGCFPKSEWFIKAQDLLRAPTVDAVQVVRCKECEHFGHFIVGEKHACNNYQLPYCKPDDFCSYGKVKKT